MARGSLISFLIQGVGAGLLFLSEILLARVLEPEGYGLFATVMACFQVLTIVAVFGCNHLILRFVPTYLVESDWGRLRGLTRFCSRLSMVLGAGLFMGIVIALLITKHQMAKDAYFSILIGMALLPIAALAIQRQSILRGLHRITTALVPELVIKPIVLMLVIWLLVWGLCLDVTPPIALTVNAIAILLAFAIGLYWQKLATPMNVHAAEAVMNTREWLLIVIPLFLTTCMQLLIVRLDLIMVGAISGREQAGIYAACSRVADLVIFALAATNVIVAPIIAGLKARNDMAGLQRVLRLLAKGLLLFSAPIALVIVLFGHEILALFGAEYTAGYSPLVILVMGQIVNALCGPVGYLLAMTGHQIQLLRILSLVTMINLSLNIMLIPKYAIIGAASATCATTVIWNLAMLRAVNRQLKVDASILSLLHR